MNPIHVAMANAARLDKHDREMMRKILANAWSEYRKGNDCAAHWRSMAYALNLSEALSEMQLASDRDSKARIAAALALLADIQRRSTWTLRADEMETIDIALCIHNVQMEHCSYGEFERAERRVKNKGGITT